MAAPAFIGRARATDAGAPVLTAVDRFARLPAAASCLVVAGTPANPLWQAAHDPALRLFIGSAFRPSFWQFLRQVEVGRLSEDRQMAIDDAVRSPVSPVFQNLTGTTTARSVLEAMITHSDNTATDMAMGAAGPNEIRALIAEAGLSHTQIPDSTRMLTAYLAGAPEGGDVGWDGIQKLLKGDGPSRLALNDKVTIASTAADMVHWYQQALAGGFFQKPETLVEFKRIQAMADAIVLVVPQDIVAYAKGGSIDWNDFHCLCLAGQMIAGAIPVTFYTAINWTGPAEGVADMRQSFLVAVSNILREAARAVG